MQISSLPGADADTEKALRAAGIVSVEQLSRVDHVEHVVPKSGLDPERVRTLVTAAREAVIAKLRAAGIEDEAALALAKPEEVAERTGMPLGDVEAFQQGAHETIERRLKDAGVPDEASLASADVEHLSTVTGIRADALAAFRGAARERLGDRLREEARVVLREGVSTARVKLGGRKAEDVPILTATRREDVAVAFQRYAGDAVVLLAGEATAKARVEGALLDGLPLFKEDRDGSQMRVRVAEVRERPPPKADPFWRRVFRK